MTASRDFETECFFITPIGAPGSDERDRADGVLEFIVGPAAQAVGLHAVRADQIAEPGQITHQIIDHLVHAKSAVADLTGLNPNVVYELAIRDAVRLPVVLIAEHGQPLPFDVAQMRTIFFRSDNLKSAGEAQSQAIDHLRAGLAGKIDSPVAAAIDIASMRRGNPTEQRVAELVETVDRLANAVQALDKRIPQPMTPPFTVAGSNSRWMPDPGGSGGRVTFPNSVTQFATELDPALFLRSSGMDQGEFSDVLRKIGEWASEQEAEHQRQSEPPAMKRQRKSKKPKDQR